ncbi:retrovirus-related pol polyprotein from transposon TNT 1-94 [Tanacetum coccineum]
MDSIISPRQKNTLAEYMILSSADNRPPMLDKNLYDSWKSRMELYMQNSEHKRMILESVEHGPFIWPTVEENGVIRTKKYAELSAAKKFKLDWEILQVDRQELLNAKVKIMPRQCTSAKETKECSRKAQRIKPTLYDGAVISKTHVAMHVIDDEEILILEEESRSKMFEKAKDPEVIAKKGKIHINYLRNTQEQANILWEIVKQVKAKQPLDGDLDLACKYATRIQELLVYVQDTCPNAITPMIVDDYSRFTWVRFLKTKDEAPAAIIKCIKNIQVRLKATVRNVRTDNGTEFVNQTLREWYENVGISHQTSVARTPQQNGVVERRNRTLVEAARTMLIFSKAPLFLWAEAINTACYTQNRSLIRLRYNKTPYELMQDKKPDLSFFHVFGSLCYPTNDHEDLGKFDAKADIGIFFGYVPAKKVFRIYNKRTQIITETIHVTFNELSAMASE